MFDKKVIYTLLLSLIFAVIIALITDNKMDDENYKALFVHKVFTKEKYDLIIAGDSRVYRGISAEIIGNKLKLKALNLGFSSGGHDKPLFDLTEKHINKKSKQKIIILGITPASLTKRAAENGHIKRVLKRKKEEVLEYRYLFPVKLFFAPTTPYKIRKKLKKQKSNDYRQEFHLKDGWIASWYDTPLPYRALKSYKEKFSKIKPDTAIIENLLKQVKKWKNEGITVYGFFPPSSPNMNELEKVVANFNTDEFLKKFLNAGGYWINIENNYFSYDGSHLEKESAIKLSQEIANKILTGKIIKKYNPEIKINDIYKVKNYDYSEEIYFKDKKTRLFNDKTPEKEIKTTIFKKTLKKEKEKNIKQIKTEISIFYTEPETQAILKCEINKQKTEINTNYGTIANKWCKIYLTYNFPKNYSENDTLKIFLNNPENKEFYIDSLKIWYIANP